MNTSRLIQLSSQLDEVLQFRVLPDGTEVDDYGHPIRNTAAVGAAGTAAVGGGLYAAGRGVPLSAGDYSKAASGAYGGVTGGARAAYDTTRAGAGRVGGYAKNLLGATKGGTSEGLAALLAKLKGVRFSSREDRLVNLSSRRPLWSSQDSSQKG